MHVLIACWNYIYLTLGDPPGSVPWPVHASHLCPGKRCCVHVQFELATNNADASQTIVTTTPARMSQSAWSRKGKLTKDDFDTNMH